MNSQPSVITLLTDFGVSDTYAGQMKGAILTVCPEARLVDLTHELPPGEIGVAARIWADAVAAFPPETIHVGVVDPGVGSERRPIATEIGPWRFVCPDNGLLTGILNHWPVRAAVELTNPRFWRTPVSPVFHGRDIFGPVAGHWARGAPLAEFGPAVELTATSGLTTAPAKTGSIIQGTVLGSDRFGNLQTDISAKLLEANPSDFVIDIGGRSIDGVSRYYSERPAGTLVALIGSNGRLEIAVNQGHAELMLGISRGAAVVVRLKQN